MKLKWKKYKAGERKRWDCPDGLAKHWTAQITPTQHFVIYPEKTESGIQVYSLNTSPDGISMETFLWCYNTWCDDRGRSEWNPYGFLCLRGAKKHAQTLVDFFLPEQEAPE